jgi:hypothetical protein
MRPGPTMAVQQVKKKKNYVKTKDGKDRGPLFK